MGWFTRTDELVFEEIETVGRVRKIKRLTVSCRMPWPDVERALIFMGFIDQTPHKGGTTRHPVDEFDLARHLDESDR